MKVTFNPQLLAVLLVSAIVVGLHSRGFASAPLVTAFPHITAVADLESLAPLTPVHVARDPFIVQSDEQRPQAHADVAGMLAVADEHAAVGASSDMHARAGADGIHLRAVVLGLHRYALVAEGSSTRIVTVGDALAGSRIRTIDLGGIQLLNGARFLAEDASK